jgi:nucleotide-binding universal stress UspA family protein
MAEVSRRLQFLAERHRVLAGQQLAKVAKRHNVAAELRVISHLGPVANLALKSLYCDLLIISPGAPVALSSARPLLQTGVPIVIVPETWNGAIGHRITVAWNASRQARRAVADALPLLIAAETVELLIVDQEPEAGRSGEVPGADIAAYLSHHGVRVELQQAFSQGRSIAEAIIDNAVERKADLIVFGAYSRPWINEAFLGGVSRRLLAQVPLPLFVSS